MRKISSIKLLIVFAVAISLSSLPGGLSRGFNLPTIPLAHATVPTTAPCDVTGLGPGATSCSQFWYPAGPAMNSLANIIYTSEITEYQTGMLGGQIDFTDWPVPSSLASSFGGSNFYVTAPEYDHGFFELQFNMANHLWGVDQNFGNSAAGIQVRQGLAHLVNRVTLVNTQGALTGQSSAIDNPIPPGDGLVLPSTCSYDSNFPEAGAGCAAGAGHGGSSYNCSFSTACPSTCVLGPAPNYAWGAQIGSADFCAAAQHFINAGIATNKNADCTLTGFVSASASQPISSGANSLCTSVGLPQSAVCFYVRADNGGRQAYGEALAEEICALLTGVYGSTVSGTHVHYCAPYLTLREGTIGPAVCKIFATDPSGSCTGTPNGTPNERWGMYTGGFGSVFPQDVMYFLYNSNFVDQQAIAGPCASTQGFVFPGDYTYT
ncbi:MAG TPA: hypothetical protein VK667_14150, partial [Ktedonobacteraceae bacterium]|nr:hypothetical protein [Ktedonobacteraceae bacterium]